MKLTETMRSLMQWQAGEPSLCVTACSAGQASALRGLVKRGLLLSVGFLDNNDDEECRGPSYEITEAGKDWLRGEEC